MLKDRWVGAEAFDDTLANLLAEDGIGWDTFFFDEAFDLLYALLAYERYHEHQQHHLRCPMSS